MGLAGRAGLLAVCCCVAASLLGASAADRISYTLPNPHDGTADSPPAAFEAAQVGAAGSAAPGDEHLDDSGDGKDRKKRSKRSTARARQHAAGKKASWLELATQGMELFNAGDMDGCIESLRAAIQRGGRKINHGVYNNLGIALVQVGQAEQAREVFENSLKLRPDFGDTHSNLAMLEAQQGNFVGARKHLHDRIAIEPTNPVVWNSLGQVSSDAGLAAEAVHAYQTVLRLSPADADATTALEQAGAPLASPATVAAAADPPVAATPRPAAAAGSAGSRKSSDIDPAVDLRVLQALADDASQAFSAKEYTKSVVLYKRAVAMDPNSVFLQMALGTACYWSSDMDRAAESFRTVMTLEPTNWKARIYAGRSLHDARRHPEAFEVFRSAIELEPANWEGHNMLGNSIMNSQNHSLLDEAVQAYTDSMELAPLNPATYINLAHAFREGDRLKEAKHAYRGAARVIMSPGCEGDFAGKQSMADGLRIRTSTLLPRVIQSQASMLRDRAEFIRSVDQLLLLQSGQPASGGSGSAASAVADEGGSSLFGSLFGSKKAGSGGGGSNGEGEKPERAGAGLLLADPVQEIGGILTFNLAYMGMNDKLIHQAVSTLYERASPSLLHVADHCYSPGLSAAAVFSWTASTEWSGQRTHWCRPKAAGGGGAAAGGGGGGGGGRRIRIGFVSANLKDHTIGKLFAETVIHLDRSAFEVTLFTFALPVDGISRHLADQITQRGGQTVVLRYELPEARAAIAAAGMDVLFYTDIGLDTLTYFLAFSRLAPVQMMTWGHPVTSGLRHMDYFVSSAELEPEEGDDEYTEAVVRLPHHPVRFKKPEMPSEIAPTPRSQYFGLSGVDPAEDAAGREHLYVCPQALFKFHPSFDHTVGQILARDPLGKLVIIHSSSTSDQLLATIVGRLIRAIAHEAAAAAAAYDKVSPLAPRDRIIVLGHQSYADFLRLGRSADVILDTFPFGGGNSHYELLSTHTPVVTLRTRQMRGRITYALYERMGMADRSFNVVAASVAEYVQMAVQLGTDKAENGRVSGEIERRVAVLYEDNAGVEELGHWIRQVVQPSLEHC